MDLPALCYNIRDQRVIGFQYDGERRRVEPHAYGFSRKGHELMRGFQVSGGSVGGEVPAWKLWRVDKMRGLGATNYRFRETRPDYTPNDSAFAGSYCAVDDGGGDDETEDAPPEGEDDAGGEDGPRRLAMPSRGPTPPRRGKPPLRKPIAGRLQARAAEEEPSGRQQARKAILKPVLRPVFARDSIDRAVRAVMEGADPVQEIEALVATDRYQALGMDAPDVSTMCKGQCEGTGWVPVYMHPEEDTGGARPVDEEQDPILIGLWEAAHRIAGKHECDGYHFVKCPDCGGTGKRRAMEGAQQGPHYLQI